MSPHRRRGAGRGALPAVLAVLTLTGLAAGCAEVVEVVPEVHEPAQLNPVEGSDVVEVTFDEAGAEQVSLQTAPVRSAGRHAVVPYEAIIYDGGGKSWVYTVTTPLTYQRAEVVIAHVTGQRVFLVDGPAVGTDVVTVGAAEVYGAELEIAGGH